MVKNMDGTLVFCMGRIYTNKETHSREMIMCVYSLWVVFVIDKAQGVLCAAWLGYIFSIKVCCGFLSEVIELHSIWKPIST